MKIKNFLFGLGVLCLFLIVGEYVNRPLRRILKDQFENYPYWLDHITFMLLGKLALALIVAVVIGAVSNFVL